MHDMGIVSCGQGNLKSSCPPVFNHSQNICHSSSPFFSQAHLDIKPDNIVVVLGPDKEFVKLLLIDFGCAKSFGNSKTLQAPTSVGSPFFVAPEVKQGKYGLNMPEADVYSIGKTLLVAILGYNPLNVEINTPAEWIAAWKVPPASQDSALVQISNKLILEKPQDRASLDDALTDFIGAFGDDSSGEIRDFNLAVEQLLERNHRLGFVGRCLPSSGKLTSSQLRVVFKPALLNAPEVHYDITYTRHVLPSRNHAVEGDENSDPMTGAAKATKNGAGNDKRPAAAHGHHLRCDH
jgi:serine/threonine protein kinase